MDPEDHRWELSHPGEGQEVGHQVAARLVELLEEDRLEEDRLEEDRLEVDRLEEDHEVAPARNPQGQPASTSNAHLGRYSKLDSKPHQTYTAHCCRHCWHVTQQWRACLGMRNDQRCIVMPVGMGTVDKITVTSTAT